jgi:D-alanyl-D-alanine carboxypeptidase/D-alanyl-D-alanine-endopeptidase (penicillin-binding protein 4)
MSLLHRFVLPASLLAAGLPLLVGSQPAQAAQHPSSARQPTQAQQPSSARQPSQARHTSQVRLATQVRQAISGSTAHHPDYAFAVGGVGTIAHHAATGTAPASTEKLLTTVTLLSEAGSGFQYSTVVSATGPVVGHTVEGDLVLRGSGDPTLTRANLHGLARRLRALGVSRVSGHVVVDDSRYDHATLAPGWKRSFVPEETGPVDAFTVDRNTWRGGSSFDHDPTHANASLWRTVLTKGHIRVRHAIHFGAPAAATQALVRHRSAPLSEIVAHTLTVSDNFDAEMMLREAGARRSGHGTRTTGIAAVRAQAAAMDVRVGKIHDGSGLSYDDRESPAQLVAWLTAARSLTGYQTLYAALPVSCRTGTLVHRLCGHRVNGIVHAKTGTLDGVNALAGWTTTSAGHPVTFAVLLSGVHNYSRGIAHLDAAVVAAVRNG